MAPESTLFGKKVLDMPQRHRLGRYLDPIGHWLPLLMREGVHCHGNLSRSSLENKSHRTNIQLSLYLTVKPEI